MSPEAPHPPVGDPKVQYKTPGNLTRRADFVTRYATRSWFDWIAARVPAPTGAVLDIGCGPGWFWHHLAGRWQPAHLTLGDISAAMLDAAASRLSPRYPVETVELDAIALPFDDASFDRVFAMHVLYHAADPARALAEIARVLKPGGQAIVTTLGAGDLAFLGDLSRELFGASGSDAVSRVFGGERAAGLIGEAFARVERHRFRDLFAVDDSDAALDYITSFPPGISAAPEARAAFRARFEVARLAAGGALPIARLQDLFIAAKLAPTDRKDAP